MSSLETQAQQSHAAQEKGTIENWGSWKISLYEELLLHAEQHPEFGTYGNEACVNAVMAAANPEADQLMEEPETEIAAPKNPEEEPMDVENVPPSSASAAHATGSGQEASITTGVRRNRWRGGCEVNPRLA